MGVNTLEHISTLVLRRFFSKIKVVGECWKWTAAKNSSGYGHLFIKNKVILSHRLSYELLVKDIPEGLQLDHLCRNRWCVNPFHLEPVTQSENAKRGDFSNNYNRKKTHCPKGHPLNGSNLLLSENKRKCRICVNKRSKKAYYRKKGVD